MTPQKEPGKEGLKILLMLASAIIITAGLQAGKQVLLPIVLSGFLAIVSYPITTFFKNKLRFPHWLAVLFTVIMDFGVLVGLGYLAQYLGQDLARPSNAKYYPLLFEKVHEFRAFLIERDWNNLADQMLQEIPDLLNSQRIVALSTGVMGQLASMLTFTTLILILMTFSWGKPPDSGQTSTSWEATATRVSANSPKRLKVSRNTWSSRHSSAPSPVCWLSCSAITWGWTSPCSGASWLSRSTSFPRSAPSSPPFPPRCCPAAHQPHGGHHRGGRIPAHQYGPGQLPGAHAAGTPVRDRHQHGPSLRHLLGLGMGAYRHASGRPHHHAGEAGPGKLQGSGVDRPAR